MAISLSILRPLLRALARLLSRCKLLVLKPLVRFAFLWAILRSRLLSLKPSRSNLSPKPDEDDSTKGDASSPIAPSPLDTKNDELVLSEPSRSDSRLQNPNRITGLPISAESKYIACSLHPYAFSPGIGSQSAHDLRAPAAMHGFTTSYPNLPNHHNDFLGGSQASRRNSPNLPFNDTLDIPSRPRTASPTHSVIVLPAVEGPSPRAACLSETFEHPRIKPQPSEYFGRYDRNQIVSKKSTEIDIDPLRTTYELESDPPGWITCLHPEGPRYFFHEQNRIFTDANLYDHLILARITEDISLIYDFIRANNIELAPTVDLVLDLIPNENGELVNKYYFADHRSRCIFFLSEYKASWLSVWDDVVGVTCASHLKHELEAQYWYHCTLFPSALQITNELVNELRDVIVFFIGDTMTSDTATAPFGNDDLHKMLSLANSLKENVGTSYGGSTSLLSRFMFLFARQRFLDWHGQPSVRLSRDQSVYGTASRKRSYFIKTLSPFLFSAPNVHLKNLETMWVDEVLHKSVWMKYIAKLNSEWQEFVLYSTVLLNANVAFLTIQTVDQPNHPYRSPAQIASYVSTVASIGAIILGLLLVRQNITNAKETAADAVEFLRRHSHETLGLEPLAIMYSLPYALLMWGMVGFLGAFSFVFFGDASIETILVVGAAWLANSIFICWCVWMFWEKEPSYEDPSAAPDSWDEKASGISSIRSLGSTLGSQASSSGKRRRCWHWPAGFKRKKTCDSTVNFV